MILWWEVALLCFFVIGIIAGGLSSICEHELTAPIGTFTSPRYPSYYKNNVDCTWHILVDPGYRIKVTVWDLHVEGPYITCSADYLTLDEPDTGNRSEIWRRCDRDLAEPFMFYSSGNEVWVRFHSDESSRGRGFNASYNAIRNLFLCDFETSGSCDLSLSDNPGWVIMQGADDSYYSGPTEDHTVRNSSGRYIVAKAKRGNPNVKRIFEMLLPSRDMSMASSKLGVQFSYHMWYAGFGRAMGNLEVILCDRSPAFVVSGDQKNAWHTEAIDLTSMNDNCTISIKVVTTNLDIAIDDVIIYEVILEDTTDSFVTYVTEVTDVKTTDSGSIKTFGIPRDAIDDKLEPTEPSLILLRTEDIAFIAVTSCAIMLVFLIGILVYVLIRVKMKEMKIKKSLSEIPATFTNAAYSTVLDDHLRNDVISDIGPEPPVRWEKINELTNGKIDEMLIVYNVGYQSLEKYSDNGIKKNFRRKKRKKKVVNFQTIKEENEPGDINHVLKGKR